MEENERKQISERERFRSTASKYDFVKVKVWLGGEGEESKHYYVLSRYLTCRMLTVTTMSQMKAVKIALELKKQLVDKELLDVSQELLESTLFSIMREKGFGDEYVNRYKMVSKFFQQRRPLVILICGSPCSGKSTLAQALASRLNLPNVLQTDIIHELLLGAEGGESNSLPLWRREDLTEQQLIVEYQREARKVRKAVTGDLVKTIRDGKPIIIEGMHVDPGLYLYEFGRHGLAHLQKALQRTASAVLLPDATTEVMAGLSVAGEAQETATGTMKEGHAAACELTQDAAEPPGSRISQRRSRYWFKKQASFALSFSDDPMHPRIAAAEPLDDQVEATHMAARSAPQSPHRDSPRVAGSPGWEWLQQLEASEDQSPGVPRRFETLPSASSWLRRKSRKWLGLSSREKTASTGKFADAVPETSNTSAAADTLSVAGARGSKEDQSDAAAPHASLQESGVCDTNGRQNQAATRSSDTVKGPATDEPEELGARQEKEAQNSSNLHVEFAPLSAFSERSKSPISKQSHRQYSRGRSDVSQASLAFASSVAYTSDGADEEEGRRPSGASAVSERLEDAAQDQVAAAADRRAVDRQEDGPVFVPIVLSMEQQDHEMLLQQWCCQQGLGGDLEAGKRVCHRVELIQEYLASYSSCNVPVVRTSLVDIKGTTNLLHEYLLECIAIQMRGC